MIHPHAELRFINGQKGFGVVATKPIPKGTITWALDRLDRLFDAQAVAALRPIEKEMLIKFAYRDREGRYVLCWDNSRYVNHSSRSNCLSTAYEFEVAVRDIEAGEEITDDYGYLNLEQPFDAIPEPGVTRTRIYPDDLLHYYREWDEQLRDAFTSFENVSQPLLPILQPDLVTLCRRIARGEAEMESIRNCYFDASKELSVGS